MFAGRCTLTDLCCADKVGFVPDAAVGQGARFVVLEHRGGAGATAGRGGCQLPGRAAGQAGPGSSMCGELASCPGSKRATLARGLCRIHGAGAEHAAGGWVGAGGQSPRLCGRRPHTEGKGRVRKQTESSRASTHTCEAPTWCSLHLCRSWLTPTLASAPKATNASTAQTVRVDSMVMVFVASSNDASGQDLRTSQASSHVNQEPSRTHGDIPGLHSKHRGRGHVVILHIYNYLDL